MKRLKTNDFKSKGRGGPRLGAGRPKGRQNQATVEIRTWLRNWFESPEGREQLAEKLKESDSVLLHCLDRAYGKVAYHFQVQSGWGLDCYTDEELEAIREGKPLPLRVPHATTGWPAKT